MKTVVCGLGKCGSRMILDLNAIIYDGDFSYQLKLPKEGVSNLSNTWDKFLNGFSSFFSKNSIAKYIPADEIPKMHLGDPDNANEVVSYCEVEGTGEKDEQSRKKLKENIIKFPNYRGACGQYHIIGEQVMLNLFEHDQEVKQEVIDRYIKRNDKDNASCFILLFSAGGGTGCGTSTVLAEFVAQKAKSEYVNLFIAGIAALPGIKESDNYKVSAGRFLTKVLSSDRATSFDAVITVGNSIMEDIDLDENQVQSQANMFAANIINSLVNSSSRYNRSPINTDGPELRKNIKGLGYFCFARKSKEAETGSLNIDLLTRALSPVSKSLDAAKDSTFEGVSINFQHPKFFPKEKWEDLIDAISSVNDKLTEVEKGNIKELDAMLNEIFPDPKTQLPLAMRSCNNVVVLRGIPNDKNSSSWEQTILVSLLEKIFPKANIHYYSTYHSLPEHTLSIIPSGYISFEIIDLITTYLAKVWETEENRTAISKMLINGPDVDADEIMDKFGDREHFEREFVDFSEIQERTSGLFALEPETWDERYITAENVASMINRVHAAMANVKRKPKSADEIDWDDPDFDI